MFGANTLSIYVFFTLFCWAIWGIIDKKALSHAKQEDVMMRLYVLVYLWIPTNFFLLNYFEPGWKLNNNVIFWSGLASAAYLLALLAYLAAMNMSEASFVLGMTAAYPLVFQFLANAVLGEALVPERLVGALIIGAGLFLISTTGSGSTENKGQTPSRRFPDARLLIYVVTATLTWGVYGIFDKKAVATGSPLLVFFSKTLWDGLFFFVLLAVYKLQRKQLDWKNKLAWAYCGVSESLLGIGGLTYLAALSMASASYVITITGCYPLLMYIFAMWLLKERFNKMRFAGILLVVVGGALVQMTAG
jgi:drug/metabolite transporter (DMT)-like permease